jgi:hypothetical protein
MKTRKRAIVPQGGSMSSYSGSLTWVSNETKEREVLGKIQANLAYIAPQSPFVPGTMEDWIDHRLAINQQEISDGLRKIDIKKGKKESECKETIKPAFGGRDFEDFRSLVLAQESIWRPGEPMKPARPHAPWPDPSERKHEGYQRSRSGYSRFPPLPRVPGNATVNWKQRAPITPFEFDKVGRPMMFFDEAAPDSDNTMESLIGDSLFEELNA